MDIVEDIFKPVAEIYVGGFAASHHGIDDYCIFRRTVVAAKQVVFLTLCWHQIYFGITEKSCDNQNARRFLQNIIHLTFICYL